MAMKMISMMRRMTTVEMPDVDRRCSIILYGGKIESSKEMQRYGS